MAGLFPFPRSRLPLARWRRAAQPVPLGGGTVLCRILDRHKIYADAEDWGISPHLMLDGYWEPRVTETILELARPGITAIDVGANLGYFTILMAAGVGPQGRVLAFEPHPRMGDLLTRSVHLNGFADRAELHRVALGDVEGGPVDFSTPKRFPGGGMVGVSDGAEMLNIRCERRRLDAVPGASEAALVKIDAEGAEQSIWRGMAGLIAGTALRHVVLEFAREAYADPVELLEQARAAGFHIERIDDVRGRVKSDAAQVLAGAPMQMLLLSR